MINDLVNSLKVQLHERVSNPVLGAFALSWIIFNYEFLVVFFSRTSLDLKLFILREGLYSSTIEHFFFWLIAPLFSSAFIIVSYPLVSFKLYEYWYQSQKKLKEIRKDIEDESPLTKAEARNIRERVTKLQLQYDEERQLLHDQISLLKGDRDKTISDLSAANKSINSAKRENDSLQDEIKKLNNLLHDNEETRAVVKRMNDYHNGLTVKRHSILELLFKNNKGVARKTLDTQFPDSASTTIALDALVKENLISHNTILDSYAINNSGREYLSDPEFSPNAILNKNNK